MISADWSGWVERGLVTPDETGPDCAMDTVRRAWDQVTGARQAYLEGDFPSAVYGIRRSMGNSTKALLLGQGYRPVDDEEVFKLARLACHTMFAEHTDAMFEKAAKLAASLPFSEDPTVEEQRIARRSVAAAAQLVALVECFVYKPAVPPDGLPVVPGYHRR